MKIEKFKKLRDNRYELILDNEDKIILYDDLIIKYNLLGKKDIDYKILSSIIQENNRLSAYYLALKYISTKLRSKREIEEYLTRKNLESSSIEEAIGRLEKDGYLNSNIYLRAYINDQVNLTNNGYYKILKNLIALGFEENEITKHLNEIDGNVWSQKVSKIITKKKKTNKNYSGYRLIQKITYDLNNLGYSKEMIEDCLGLEDFNDQGDIEKEYQKLYNKLSKKYEGRELEYKINSKLIQKGFDINNRKTGD